MDQIVDLMRQTKQDWVASDPENTDLAMYLHFWRGDDLVAMVQTPLDRDTGLAAGHLGAAGFGASAMSLTFESYTSSLGESPITGKPWEPHEMQYTFEAVPQNATEHWVTECLTTSAHERGGGFSLCSMPYVIEHGKVDWLESQITVYDGTEKEVKGGGAMFSYLQHAMASPTIEEAMAERAENEPLVAIAAGLVEDPEQRTFHLDMATYTALQERDLVTAVAFTAEAGSRRAEWIKERLGPGSVVPPGQV